MVGAWVFAFVQVTVCKQSVELLMELVGLDGTLDTSEVGYTIRQLARDILHNLALNKANITELYKVILEIIFEAVRAACRSLFYCLFGEDQET